MEPEGITKFCARKVRMNRPTTSTEQMPANDSSGVSSLPALARAGLAGAGAGRCAGDFFFFVIESQFPSGKPVGKWRRGSQLRASGGKSGSNASP